MLAKKALNEKVNAKIECWFTSKLHLLLQLTFEFKQHPKYPIEDKILKLISKLVKERARKIIATYHEKVAELRQLTTEK